jgi:hypothetical protein
VNQSTAPSTSRWIPIAILLLVVVAIYVYVTKDKPKTDEPTKEKSAEDVDTAGDGDEDDDEKKPTPRVPGTQGPVENAMPFTISFEQAKLPADFPALQSYVIAPLDSGNWLAVGGRLQQGLHTFSPKPANNFKGPNNFIWALNPKTGVLGKFDVNLLPDALRWPLQSTNRQGHYDREKDYLYISGGYGLNAPEDKGGKFVTFDMLHRFPATKVFDIVVGSDSDADKATKIAALIETTTSGDYFKVTGGEMPYLDGQFFLVFGQEFTGGYMPFTGADQKYTEEVRVFKLNPRKFEVLSKGALRTDDKDRPYHRRDGCIVETVDPATGKARIASFGGVFPPGIIGGYLEPIYIDGNGAKVDRSVKQLMSQYNCPVVIVHDASSKTVYQTFVGGIGHWFYHQTAKQAEVYKTVADQARNDGLPFVADVYTLVQKGDGTYQQWIWPDALPMVANPKTPASGPDAPAQTNLLGAGTNFIPNTALMKEGVLSEAGIADLAKVAAKGKVLAGYLYGGIRADYPLPLRPGAGTNGTNLVLEIYITPMPTSAIPAEEATEATAGPTFSHTRDGG